jgi:YYY domain-containing protein
MAWETRQWLAATPLSSLRKLEPYRFFVFTGVLLALAAVYLLSLIGVYVAWLALPLMVWAGLLLVRPGQDEAKRLVLFLIGTGLFLTLMVEVIVLTGDISRMNTVFKFYMQVWVLLGLAASLAIAWTVKELREWSLGWRAVWQSVGAILVGCAALFLLIGVSAKMNDRMAAEAPRTLDGNAYMPYALYYDRDQELHLDQDYAAIRWLQENVEGSPVIVEAHTGEYRWGSRITINTGLPAVLGWNWHQRQQRTGHDLEVWARDTGVDEFYLTNDLNVALEFLDRMDVAYIVVGQMERAYYGGPGLDKFELHDGRYWEEVYRDGETVIYRVVAG